MWIISVDGKLAFEPSGYYIDQGYEIVFYEDPDGPYIKATYQSMDQLNETIESFTYAIANRTPIWYVPYYKTKEELPTNYYLERLKEL